MSLSQDIESRVNILDIVNRYIQTKKAWVNYKANCPFHQEKTPSFVISPQKNIAYCFSCHKWWWPIRFLMEIEKLEFREAVQILAKEAWVELKTDFLKEKGEKTADIFALYKQASIYYNESIYKEENKKALNYLLNRWLTHDTIARFQLWFSNNPRDLFFSLKQQWFDEKFMIDSWLFVSPTRDKFFGRIVYPIANFLGHVVAFTGRVMDDALPKYLNSPASHIFDKSSILYGLHLAKNAITKADKVLIVEWQMDTITLHQAWYEYAVGISGTALTKDHMKWLKRFTKHIYLCLDSDNAGIQATFLSLENILNEEIDVHIVQIPNGKDPDEFIKGWGEFQECIQHAITPVQFYLSEGRKKFDIASLVWKKALISSCLHSIVHVHSQIEVDIHIREIAKILDITPDILYGEYKNIKRWIKKPSTDESLVTNESISPIDTLAVYIRKYHLFDLFSEHFRYTERDLSEERNFSLLTSVIQKLPHTEEQEEYIWFIDLMIEEENSSLSHDSIVKKCLDLIRFLHGLLLQKEKNTLLYWLSLESLEYAQVYNELIKKAITLGIKPDILKK